MSTSLPQDWLLIFYSVPAHPVSGRVKIWRRLAKAGAVQLKGAVYVLPATEEHRELFQWIIGEVKTLGGDGSFVRTARIETLREAEVRSLFNAQRDAEYRLLDKQLDALERKVRSMRKGPGKGGRDAVAGPLAAAQRTYTEVRGRDFFGAPGGKETGKRFQAIEAALAGLREAAAAPATFSRKDPGKYQRKVWVTRKRPFVDRMASAWLVRRFVDREAAFKFIDEQEREILGPDEIAFDMESGEFTHVGDLCTFEVLVRSFGLRDKAVRTIAEIVHDLDVKDDKYGRPETAGIEEILAGIRKTARDDADMLDKGMAAFEMLYQSKT